MYIRNWGCKILIALLGLSVLCAEAGRRNVSTVYQDDFQIMDAIVSRAGSDGNPKAYSAGELGVLLPTYDRESLFLAYRTLTLGKDKLARLAANTPPEIFEQPDKTKGVRNWLSARKLVTDTPPAIMPGEYRDINKNAFGAFINCGPSPFNVAADTLKSLVNDPKLGKPAAEEWLAAQDKVFALCMTIPTDTSGYPEPLGAGNPLQLRQLREYQIAAAYFYGGQYDEALIRFDRIAADKKHPMRAWATHAAVRSILRKASLDTSLQQQIYQIRASSQTAEQKQAAAAAAIQEDRARLKLATDQIAKRVAAILADNSLQSIHQPAVKLKTQASLWLTPANTYMELTQMLAKFDRDVAISGDLYKWAQLGNKLFDYRGNLDLTEKLRGEQVFYDWIKTIQGCHDNPASPNHTGRCEQENAHALKRWKATRQNAWLVASLITAQSYTPEVGAAISAARKIKPDAPEYLTFRYHMSRVLRSAERKDEARAILKDTKIGNISSASALNLFAQENLALARSANEAIPHLLRRYSHTLKSSRPVDNFTLGADGEELINRRMSSEDLLQFAEHPSTPPQLKKQLLVAAWWRAELAGKYSLSNTAAQKIAAEIPTLKAAVSKYVHEWHSEKRRLILVDSAYLYRISPQVGFVPSKDFATQRRRGVLDLWCSFDSADYVGTFNRQRIKPIVLNLSADPGKASAENKSLVQIGTGADWMARIALDIGRSEPTNFRVKPLLQAVVRSADSSCASENSDSLVNEAKQVLTKLPAR
jgi:hypothetical protein